MESKLYKEIKDRFTEYLTEKKLRKTEERYIILKEICAFSGNFDINELYEKINEPVFHISKSTVYNTLGLLLKAGLVVSHQISTLSVKYELKRLAETHLHLYCTQCGMVRDVKNSNLKSFIYAMQTPKFTPEFYSLYVYGICWKCEKKLKKKVKNGNKKAL
ncbi:MAG: transcriptional repressor [Tannerellaceae bacterium]|jgi:Fur family ferric uptake transcriptional regulator|nr:transcriptional repressor [Tannerellaceae bacterium]